MEEWLTFGVGIDEHNTEAPSLGDLALLHDRPLVCLVLPYQQRPKRLHSLCLAAAGTVFCFPILDLLHMLLGRDTVDHVENRLFSCRPQVSMVPVLAHSRASFALDLNASVFLAYFD